MSEDDSNDEEHIILSQELEKSTWKISLKSLARSILPFSIFTAVYMIFIITLPLGIVLEPISDYLLDFQSRGVGLPDRMFGLKTITAIYCAALFIILSDALQVGFKRISQYVPERRLNHLMKTYPRIWGNSLIFLVVIPVSIIVVTTIAASQFSNGEDLWAVMSSGYTGAIIGAYRQIAVKILPSSQES